MVHCSAYHALKDASVAQGELLRERRDLFMAPSKAAHVATAGENETNTRVNKRILVGFPPGSNPVG
jgi:hypothetical protein